MSFLCPICNNQLLHTRVNDGMIIRQIENNGKFTVINDDRDGFDTVYCSINNLHTIPVELQNKIIEL